MWIAFSWTEAFLYGMGALHMYSFLIDHTHLIKVEPPQARKVVYFIMVVAWPVMILFAVFMRLNQARRER